LCWQRVVEVILLFGMGTELSVKELLTMLKKPKGILNGIPCNYTIMPVFGFMFAIVFSFPKKIAAGIILIGCFQTVLRPFYVICYPGKPVARKVAKS
jgi:predicted Na+-dependent transporter